MHAIRRAPTPTRFHILFDYQHHPCKCIHPLNQRSTKMHSIFSCSFTVFFSTGAEQKAEWTCQVLPCICVTGVSHAHVVINMAPNHLLPLQQQTCAFFMTSKTPKNTRIGVFEMELQCTRSVHQEILKTRYLWRYFPKLQWIIAILLLPVIITGKCYINIHKQAGFWW